MARSRKKSRTRKPGNHRQAPRPASWDCARGTCRFCGEPIIENGLQNNRKHWHQPCADIWRRINSTTESRRAVFLRQRGVCQGDGCGFASPLMADFDMDHIEPLFEANGDLRYWMMPNLQLLCKACHKRKTLTDMVRFRAMKAAESSDE